MIEKILKKRGHSNPKKGIENVRLQDPFERRRIIYKDPTAVSELVDALHYDAQKAIREGMDSTGNIGTSPEEFFDMFKSRLEKAIQDLRSGKEGSITVVADIHRDMDAYFADKGGGTTFSDIFPLFDKAIEKHLGEKYNPDDMRGL